MAETDGGVLQGGVETDQKRDCALTKDMRHWPTGIVGGAWLRHPLSGVRAPLSKYVNKLAELCLMTCTSPSSLHLNWKFTISHHSLTFWFNGMERSSKRLCTGSRLLPDNMSTSTLSVQKDVK